MKVWPFELGDLGTEFKLLLTGRNSTNKSCNSYKTKEQVPTKAAESTSCKKALKSRMGINNKLHKDKNRTRYKS